MPPLRKAVSITHPSMQREKGGREKNAGQFTDGVRPGWERRGLHLAADSTVSFGQKQGQLPVWVGSGQRSGSAALLAEFTVSSGSDTAGHHAPLGLRITRYI